MTSRTLLFRAFSLRINSSNRQPDDITSEDDIRKTLIRGDWKGGHVGEVADVGLDEGAVSSFGVPRAGVVVYLYQES